VGETILWRNTNLKGKGKGKNIYKKSKVKGKIYVFRRGAKNIDKNGFVLCITGGNLFGWVSRYTGSWPKYTTLMYDYIHTCR
jgi:hypothetical protein